MLLLHLKCSVTIPVTCKPSVILLTGILDLNSTGMETANGLQQMGCVNRKKRKKEKKHSQLIASLDADTAVVVIQ